MSSKLLQLNVWGGRLENTLIDFFESEKPDIICLQEAISYEKPNAAFFYSVERMQETCELPYMAFAPVFTFGLMKGTAQFGNCIISRFPIKRTEIVFTRLEHNKDFDFNEHDYNARNFVHCEIDINGKKVHVVTHHGHHVPKHKDGNAETDRQMAQLTEYVMELQGPVILTGDFNLKPTSGSIAKLNQSLHNLSVENKLQTTRNELTYKKEVCDYIFVNDSVKVKDFAPNERIVSDHSALIMNFSV